MQLNLIRVRRTIVNTEISMRGFIENSELVNVLDIRKFFKSKKIICTLNFVWCIAWLKLKKCLWKSIRTSKTIQNVIYIPMPVGKIYRTESDRPFIISPIGSSYKSWLRALPTYNQTFVIWVLYYWILKILMVIPSHRTTK